MELIEGEDLADVLLARRDLPRGPVIGAKVGTLL
jgi:hypothetical protein